jgi:hypothetical protein
MIDQYSKLLEVDRDYIYKTDIPRLQSEVLARLSNLQQSRWRAEKTGDVDIYVKDEYYGLTAINMALKALFGGKDNPSSITSKKAKNVSTIGTIYDR